MMHVSLKFKLLILFIIHMFSISKLLASDCSKDGKPAGECKKLVKTGINVCEDSENGISITGDALRHAESTHFGKSTNFSKLVKEFQNAQSVGESAAQSYQECQDAEKALAKDCKKMCQTPGATNCRESQKYFKDLAKKCKDGQDAVTQMANIAAQDAAAVAAGQQPSGSDVNNGTSGGGTTGVGNVINGTTDTPSLSAGSQGFNEEQLNAASDGGALGGSTAGGASGAGSGSGSGAGGAGGGGDTSGSKNPFDAYAAGILAPTGSGASKKAGSGAGLNGDGSNFSLESGVGETDGSQQAAAAAANGKKTITPGYFIWGVPTKKKKKYLFKEIPDRAPTSTGKAITTTVKPLDTTVVPGKE